MTTRKAVLGCMRLLAGRYIGARRTASELRARLKATDSERVQRMLERSAAASDERMAALEAIITAIAVEASRSEVLVVASTTVAPMLRATETASRGAWHPPEGADTLPRSGVA